MGNVVYVNGVQSSQQIHCLSLVRKGAIKRTGYAGGWTPVSASILKSLIWDEMEHATGTPITSPWMPSRKYMVLEVLEDGTGRAKLTEAGKRLIQEADPI